VGIVVENIIQDTNIERHSDRISSESLSLAVVKAHTPDNGLANLARPLPIARNQSDTIISDAVIRAESGYSADLHAPQYAPCREGPIKQAENRRPHLISCPVNELRAHPSYIRHRLSIDASRLSALAERGDLAFRDPIIITHDRIVIDGYARWELAKRTGRPALECMEHELSQEEALAELIRAHDPSRGLTDFLLIELALDLETHFQQRALMNQQAGGKGKGSSKLTTAQRVDTRQEVARLAGVSCGNVRKVKNILRHACSSLLQAVRTKEVSIHLADKWSYEPPAKQQEYLREFRIQRGIKKKARCLVAAHLPRIMPLGRDYRMLKPLDVVGLLNEFVTTASKESIDNSTIDVQIIDAPGHTIFVTEELARSLMSRQGIVR
jgi:hypothetical protein